ncbi:acyltransferase [Cloacibacterium sp.]|uniref:acyltransferase n=1 Tax=Cloacibacterium sp. TaxID=1913682 RepID=UPI0039E4742E
MKSLLIKILMLIPKTIDKIGKINTLHQLKSLKNASIHPSFRIGKNMFLLLSQDAKITIEEGVIIKDYNAIRIRKSGELILGKNVNISDYVSINCLEKIEIGEDSGIAEGCKFYDHDHAFVTEPEYEWKQNEFNTAPIIIGKNVKIYSEVTILKGVTIGDNCIIGTKCLINRSIPANSIIMSKVQNLKIPLM